MNVILDILFPKKCVGCNKEGSYFCHSCVRNIKQAELICPRCDKPSIKGQIHPLCKERFGLDGLWSLGLYQDPLKKAIQKLKYKGIKELAEILTDLVIEYWDKSHRRDWVVISVPLYWYRENNRSFNQVSLIGQILSKKLGLDYCDGLKRIRYTKSQVKLRGKQRKENIKNAFAINSQFSIVNSQLILIDDVWTTGSTLRECCYVLKRAGAKKVWALTLAR